MTTRSEEIWNVQLTTVFPKEYRPTYAEFFETMARQTRSHLTYDPKTPSGWLLEPPAMALPYTISLAEDWKPEDRGLFVAYVPRVQKVGMDIYMMGRYSGVYDEKKTRESIALTFANMLDQKASLMDMRGVKVNDADALYFETHAPKRPDVAWRQWVFIKNGEAFVIASSIEKANEAKLLPQVQAMVDSFKVTEPAPASLGL